MASPPAQVAAAPLLLLGVNLGRTSQWQRQPQRPALAWLQPLQLLRVVVLRCVALCAELG